LHLCQKYQDNKLKVMRFTERIRQLREKLMPQRKFAATLEIDTPMYSKMERGDHRAKHEQITVITQLLQVDEDMLVALWIADKILQRLARKMGLRSMC
jgi:transcriptional regulator with XRE-family HTH domain